MPKKWLQLEANPDVMNAFAHELGLSPSLAFHDVYGFDDDLLEFIPEPCVAVLMLFPLTPRTESVAGVDAPAPDAVSSVWFARQTVSNACGTMGVIHAALNAKDAVVPGSRLESLRAACEG